MENIDKIRIIRYKQNQNEFLTTVLPFHIIDKYSEVLEYGRNPDGYQRSPNKIHYLKVKSYITTNQNEFKFPSTIILGADKAVLSKGLIKKDTCGEFMDYSDLKLTIKLFRIVDGQHRIAGLREAMKDIPSIKDFLLPVTIIISTENKKSTELEIFTQINSTAKRISTDLAELAKYNYQIREKSVNEKDVIMHVSIKTAYKLKEKGVNSIWNSGIKFDIHSEVTLGIVGVTSFCESIKGIVEFYVDKKRIKKLILDENKDGLINYCDKEADVISALIDNIWNTVVFEKWSSCFKKLVVKDENNELVDIFYSKEYYIQHTLGVKAINVILGDSLKLLDTGKVSTEDFKKIIFNSKVSVRDWSKGGPFSGLSSESGFSKVRKMIRNEIPVPKV
ncbi:MAG: DGQHR domain-containing protein [Bacteroidia bacterium]